MQKIKYVLLAISHPTYQPSASEVASFLIEQLPEFKGSNAKTGWFSITGRLTQDAIRNAAIESFGKEASDDNKYTYRTISFTISGGEGKIFVIYEKAKKEGCFIATACYGDYNAYEVLILREFRDKVLFKSLIGRAFVLSYYKISPPIASFISKSNKLQDTLKTILIKPLSKIASNFLKKQ